MLNNVKNNYCLFGMNFIYNFNYLVKSLLSAVSNKHIYKYTNLSIKFDPEFCSSEYVYNLYFRIVLADDFINDRQTQT